MSTIYLNGVNFGDSSKYKDLISKPTINTHIVEESNTSSDLDIFKYITREDLENLNHLNPYCLYAVRDEDDGPDGFYFSNGYQTYVYNNYRVVEDLVEDTTTLQYLIEDTDLYSKGLWGYIETSPDTFEFIQITNSYDDLTIVVENKLFQQKNGYIYGDTTFETNIINQVNPITVEQIDESTILSLKMENHIYAPNTKYKLVVNYVGVSFTYEMTPNGASGNDILEFDKPLKIKLSKDSYPSSNPNDYLITLSWFKPLDISFINPLYFNLNDSFKVKDGKIGVNLTELDYSSISKVTDYLYSVHYDFLDELYAKNNFIENAPPLVGCTSFRKNNMFCRNFDTVYSDKAEFVVKTDKAAGRYATLGIAYSNINKEIVETGEYSKEYKAVPFNLVDGINEKGLVASIHTLLLDTASTSQTTTPEVEVKDTKNAFLLVRYILDSFAAAKEAAEYIRDYIAVYTPNTYFSKKATTQILISDSSSTYILEFTNGKNVLIDVSTKPYITNFSVEKVVYNSDGSVYTPADVPTHTPTTENKIPKYSRGLERYNTLNTGYPDIFNRVSAREMLDDLKYDLCYIEGLASDFTRVEDSLTIDTSKDTIMANSKVLEMIENYNNRTREDANTYFTSHSAIYNLFDFSLRIVAQEDTEEYLFGLPYKEPSAGYPLGEISDVIVDTRENTRLQNIIDKGILDEEIFYVEYDFQEKVFLNKDVSTDSVGSYVSLAGVLTDSGYTYIKVYIDDEYKVLGAKRFKVKLASFKDSDIGKNKYLLWNTFLSCKESGYITFSNAKSFKLKTLTGWHGDGTVEWSVDKTTWTTWDGTTEITSAISSGKHEIQIRGISNTALSDGTTSTIFVIIDQNDNTSVRGDLLALLDCTDLTKDPADYAFKELFKNSTNLTSASGLIIPVTHSKYQNLLMFEGCTNLTAIPSFDPATVLAEGSCQQMFKNCTSIVSPKFPVTDTATKCFKNMFEGCTSILQTDPLPSDNIAEEAYMGMFKDCTSIYTPTLISASTVETRGMSEMFKNCTGLLQPSSLTALTFGDEACKSMFEGCDGIVWGTSGTSYRIPTTGTATAGTDSFKNMMANNSGVIPELIGTPLPNKEYFVIKPDFEFISTNTFKVSGLGWPTDAKIKYSYNEIKWYNWDKSTELDAVLDSSLNKYRILFRSASNVNSSLDGAKFIVASDNKNVEVKGELGNLVTNPTPTANTFKGLFSNNETLNISENLVLPEVTASNAFESLFENCVNLTNTPTKLPATIGEAACLKMFAGCTKIKKTPIFNGTALAAECCKSMFEGCTALDFSYPLTATEIKSGCYSSMFKDCSALKTPPVISGANIEEKCYSAMFKNCIALQTTPTLPVTTLADYCYSEMFSGCVLITSAPTLPANEMKPWCYSHMFDGCIRLQVVPALPATTLAKYCYTYMFNGCSGFFNAPVLPATELYEESYSGMFAGCTRMITLPDLSLVTTMDKASAANMFNGCSAIPATEVIKLPTAELTEDCYLGMFKGCKNIENPPSLPKTTLQPNCYKEMFSGCEKLKTVPKLLATTLATGCYWSMFEGCAAITKPCKLPALNMVDNCYNSMFKGCKSIPWKTSGKIYRVPSSGTGVEGGTDWNKDMFLNNEGENVPYPLVINTDYHLQITFDTYFTLLSPNDMTVKHTFDEGVYYSYDKLIWNEVKKDTPITIINNLNNIPGGSKVYIAGEINEENYGKTFNIVGTDIVLAGELIGLIEEDLQEDFATNDVIKLNNLFENCSILDASDLVIPEFSSGNTGIFKELFKGSTIKNPCQFPTTISENCYEGTFENCTQLRYTPEFNATTLAKECYLNMFKGCTSLVQTSQELRATVLAESCYKSMFEGCTSIEYPSIIHATTMAPTSCADMFKGCTNITWGASGVEYRIPFDKSQSGSPSTNWSANMFDGTSGVSIPTTPDINVVYHTIPNFDKWITLEAPSMYHIDNTTNALNNNLLFYSTDNGTTWTTLPATLDTSDKICIAGIYANGNLVITGGDNKVALGGELIGLYNNIVEDKFDKTDYGFKGLFKNSVGLSDASGLILPKIGENNKEAYAELFYGCTNLLYAPDFSKVVKLSESACERAFMNCESLIASPELPALELAPKCYKEMFKGCITISMPTQLPAIIMADSCYQSMYEDCAEIKWGSSGTSYVIPKDDTTGISATDWNKDMFKNNSGAYPNPPLLNTTYHVTDYITLYSDDPSEMVTLKTENTTLSFSYSTDTINWNTLSPGAIASGSKLYVMGITPGGFSPTAVPHFSIMSSLSESNGTSGIIIKGNLKALCGESTTYYFSGLFKDSDIYDARKLIIPNTSMGDYCYKEFFKGSEYLKYSVSSLSTETYCPKGVFSDMFYDCIALTNTPDIKFNSLGEECAYNMFYNCKSLVTPPKITYTSLCNNMSTRCFDSMFRKCANLTSTPSFPQNLIAIGVGVCQFMFEDCVNLVNISILPNIIGKKCYYFMFTGCEALTTAPELPATTMEPYCYSSMLSYCKSLTTAPELPATTLAEGCYSSMFNGCSLLETPPELPATTLASDCYSLMFWKCISLETPPELPATVASTLCYYGMFNRCKKLKTCPEIKLTNLTDGDYCCVAMFEDCVSLTKPAKLSATYLSLECYKEMYKNCSNIKWRVAGEEYSVPSPTSAAAIESTDSLKNMFLGTSSYDGTPVPETPILNQIYYLKDTLKAQFTFEGTACSIKNEGSYPIKYSLDDGTTWVDLPIGSTSPSADKIAIDGEWDCSSTDLDNADGDRIAIASGTNVKVSGAIPKGGDAVGLFRSNNNLVDASGITFPTIAGSYSGMFKDCINLVNTPNLTSTTLSPKCYKYMFLNCTSIIDAPKLPATILKEECYMGMFKGCSNLLAPCALESASLDTGCYHSMFEDCVKLRVLPTLPAVKLSQNCYERMFANCTQLTWGKGISYRIPRIGSASITGSDWNKEMFAGCSGELPEGTGEPLEEQSYNYGAVSTLVFTYNDTRTGQWITPCIHNNTGKDFKYSYDNVDWHDFLPGDYMYVYKSGSETTLYVSGVFYGELNSESVGKINITEGTVKVAGELYPRMNYSGLFGEQLSDARELIFPDICGTYINMFKDTVLLYAPTLPAQDLLAKCYKSMFEATSLTECPELPAANLADNCYEAMFKNCANIEECPAFSIIELKPYCYANMFDGCTGLKSPAILPALNMAENCYNNMFANCVQFAWKDTGTVYRLPSTDTGVIATDWAKEMFINNSGALPGTTTPGTPEINTDYHFILIEKTELVFNVIDSYKGNWANITNNSGVTLSYSIDGKTTWNSLPSGDTYYLTSNYTLYLSGYIISTRDKPRSIGVDSRSQVILAGTLAPGVDYYQLFAEQDVYSAKDLTFPEASGDYSKMFMQSGLVTPPLRLPSKNVGKECYSQMFADCGNLRNISFIVDDAVLGEKACYRMYFNCRGMEYIYYRDGTYKNGDIGPFTLGNLSCYQMFQGCNLLREIPTLPSKIMAPGCYKEMFMGCSFIWGEGNDYIIPSADVGTEASNWSQGMFSGNEGTLPEGSGTPLINTTYKYKYIPITRLYLDTTDSIRKLNITNNTNGDLRYSIYFDNTFDYSIGYFAVGQTIELEKLPYYNCDGIEIFGAFKTDSTHSLIIQSPGGVKVTGNLRANCDYDYLFYDEYITENASNDDYPNCGITKADGLIFPTECGSYKGMFRNNKNLYNLPNLPATNLKDNCYYEMFRDCSRISFANTTTPRDYRVPSGTGTGISGVDSLKNMFLGCSGYIPTSGTPLINTTYYLKEDPYIRITSISSSNVSNFVLTNNLNDVIKYSTSIDGTKSTLGIGSSISTNDIYLWNCENKSSSTSNHLTITGANVSVSGVLKDSCNYMNLFRNCSTIKDASGLKMSKELTEYCYSQMFYECSSLTTPPLSLPATTLTDGCYECMFQNCYALTTAPELPATNLTYRCYYAMFSNCYVLAATPELPATTLGVYCYSNMFAYCSSLTTPPELPVTNIADFCYSGMFQNCNSLTTPPELPATTLCRYCYEYMFRGCASLTTAPELPATLISVCSYNGMFEGCISLTTPPELPATTMELDCYRDMFRDCISLTTAPELPSTTLDMYCYSGMFYNCASLTTPPALPATTLTDGCYQQMFQNCALLTTAPELSATTLDLWCYQGMFANCTSLTTPPALPATNLAIKCYDNMFSGCTSLTTAPELPATTLVNYCYEFMFQGCTSLTTPPELPATVLIEQCYYQMFYGCTSLTTAPELPATTLDTNCYYQMFRDCISLTTAPELPATELAPSCYSGMFEGCTSLIRVPELPATNLRSGCYANMFEGCTSLTAPCILPSTNIFDSCYREMFANCTGITWCDPSGIAYRLPPYGSGTGSYGWSDLMFINNSGSFPERNGTPSINTTYFYLANKTTLKFTGTDVIITNSLGIPLQYSIDDGATWIDLASSEVTPSSNKVWIKGQIDQTSQNTSLHIGGSNVSVSGQLEDHVNYKYLFADQTALVDASGLKGATTLTDWCYQNMFRGCTSLTATPELPATRLAYYCYTNMFQGCTSLTTAPELPATTLASNCYNNIFNGCTSLTAPPTLPATQLDIGCYSSMFQGCTSLTTVPELPATNLAERCYGGMFAYCSSLTTPPQLPATELAYGCYEDMFSNCSSLAILPELPATTLADYCYYDMFEYCVKIKFASTGTPYRIPSGTTAGTSGLYSTTYMFVGCSGDTPGTPLINKTYYYTNT